MNDVYPILTNTYGLVACGGLSSRMNADKCFLVYHNQPQCYEVYEMMRDACAGIFISCKQKQARHIDKAYQLIADEPEFGDIGPMAALLTAFDAFPERDLLLIGCDYPLMDKAELERFAVHCSEKGKAGSFCNADGFYEPLLAWYPYRSFPGVEQQFLEGNYSLQQYLKSTGAFRYFPTNPRCMRSADTPGDFNSIIHELQERQTN